MKVFITLAVVCLTVIAFASPLILVKEQNAKVEAHFQDCIKQENVSEEEANRYKNGDFANLTQNSKCAHTCFLEKSGFLKDGAIQDNVVLELLVYQYGEDKIKTVLNKCKDVKGADRCDTGYQISVCFQKAKTE